MPSGPRVYEHRRDEPAGAAPGFVHEARVIDPTRAPVGLRIFVPEAMLIETVLSEECSTQMPWVQPFLSVVMAEAEKPFRLTVL